MKVRSLVLAIALFVIIFGVLIPLISVMPGELLP
jgi:hypothetical protein